MKNNKDTKIESKLKLALYNFDKFFDGKDSTHFYTFYKSFKKCYVSDATDLINAELPNMQFRKQFDLLKKELFKSFDKIGFSYGHARYTYLLFGFIFANDKRYNSYLLTNQFKKTIFSNISETNKKILADALYIYTHRVRGLLKLKDIKNGNIKNYVQYHNVVCGVEVHNIPQLTNESMCTEFTPIISLDKLNYDVGDYIRIELKRVNSYKKKLYLIIGKFSIVGITFYKISDVINPQHEIFICDTKQVVKSYNMLDEVSKTVFNKWKNKQSYIHS